MLTLTGLHIYPVKGCRGIAVDAAAVEPWGLAGDRRWMVVDPSGRFVSQREEPRLALVSTALLPGGGLRLGIAGAREIAVGQPGPDAASAEVVVWRDTVAARDGGEAAARWLEDALGRPLRLVFMDAPATARPVDPDFCAPGDTVSFADGFPLLVTTEASLADLNARLADGVPMGRFRPNLEVAGGGAWDEDGWTRVQVGPVVFRVVKDCARCAVTTVDQETGVRASDTEPLRTLAGFRRKGGGRIIFGQNLVPEGPGTLRLGDPVALLGLVGQ